MAKKVPDEITRKAYAEIMAETKRAASNSETIGTSAWKKRSIKPNKGFLQSTLIGTLKSNNRESKIHSKAETSGSKRLHSTTQHKRRTSGDEEDHSKLKYPKSSKAHTSSKAFSKAKYIESDEQKGSTSKGKS